MNIHMNLFAYALPDDLLRSFESINGPDLTIHLFLHSRIPAVVAACEKIARHSNVVYHAYGYNRGLARGWNETIAAAVDDSADMVIGWTDDMYARPGDIDRIAATVLANPQCAFVNSPCWVEKTQREEVTGLALPMTAIRKIGYFDVNCDPISFSDCDWQYRAQLAGLLPVLAADTYLIHAGAKTRDVMPEAEGEFMRHFEATRAYYEKKWGGDYHQETFMQPFNDPKYGLTIAREDMDNPYPEHARADVILP